MMSDVSYKVGFMFPGQGGILIMLFIILICVLMIFSIAQTVGMAAAICNEIPAAKALFDKASSILGYDLLSKVCISFDCKMF
jgi:hypothetical protein